MKPVFLKELKTYFFTATGYVFLVVFMTLSAVFFMAGNMTEHSGNCLYLLRSMSYLWMLLCPILTMRLFAGERSQHTDQLLFSSPVSIAGMVSGKYLAAVCVLLTAVVLSFVFPLVITLYGSLCIPETLVGYLGFTLMGISFTALDLLISCICDTPVTACVAGVGCNLAFWLFDVLSMALNGTFAARILRFLSPNQRFTPYTLGQLSFSNLLFSLCFSLCCLLLSVRILSRRISSDSKNLFPFLRQTRVLAPAVRTFGVILICTAFGIVSLAGDTLEKRFALQRDYSFNGATSQSIQTTQALQELQVPVHAYVLSTTVADQTILSLLDRYCAVTQMFTYSEESLARNPFLLTRFNSLAGENEVTGDCIILYCEQTDRARVYHEDDFPVYAYSAETGYYTVTGFNYEKPLTEGILYVSQEQPAAVQLLRGHNELSGENLTGLIEILESSNYAVSEANLMAGDDLIDGAILIILCPQYDLHQQEYEKILAFLQEGNSLVYCMDYADPTDLDLFSSLLTQFGVRSLPGMVIAESEEHEGYYGNYPAYLMPQLAKTPLTEKLIGNNQMRLIMPGSRALLITSLGGTTDAQAFIVSPRSYVRDWTASAPESAEKQEGDQEGFFALGVYTQKLWENGSVSHAVIFGNALIFSDTWLLNNTDSPALFTQALEYAQGSSPIRLDIPCKTLERQTLDYASPAPLIALALFPALLGIAAAFLILIPRKHR